jgi:very-short-patch-repair endonuclease
MQLSFIPGLNIAQEHALMDAAGMPKGGRAKFAQSSNALFAFAETWPARNRRFLRDQFRSAPAIVDYLNDAFYDGRLVTRCDEDSLAVPRGYKPGLHWEDVRGRAFAGPEGGAVNEDEALAISEFLRKLLVEGSFGGSIGIISPFNAQVALLQRKLAPVLQAAGREQKLRVSTIDRFQGGEADVILFSLVAARGMNSGPLNFLRREQRRVNVAISRARALCVVFGDLGYAEACKIDTISGLARRAKEAWSPPRQPFDSLWERRLNAALRRRGLEPYPQYSVGSRYLDFALFGPQGVKLDLEVDGRKFHTDPDGQRKAGDILRDAEMQARGWKVRRFWVYELAQDMEGCLDRVERDLRQP